MQYEITGGNLPVLKLKLQAGETVTCESGAMSWMDDEIAMQTEAGGIGKMFGRMLTKESAFLNTYEAHRDGEIAFASKFPGSIMAVEVTPERGIVIQKGSFLAYVGNIENEVFFQKRMSTGFFGGEGFLMRRYYGNGIVFLEVDGSAHEYEIPAGDCKVVDTGHVAALSDSCSLEIRTVKGLKNKLLGGEGFFHTVVKGPGKVLLQSMPIANTAMELYAYMPHPSNNG